MAALAKDDDWLREAAISALDEHEMTPFDALHAGIVATGDERVLSTEQEHDAVGLDRTALEPDE